jgi:Ala-tRNA(Pro) deacylase
MAAMKLKEFLDRHNVKYVSIAHSAAYTAQEIAELTHTKGRELAKTVIVKIDGVMGMAVLSASDQVDLALLEEGIKAEHVELATEAEFRDKFPECETGAMPPFGNLYGMRVVVDLRLMRDKEIAFNAGTHTELIRLSLDDFQGLVQPTIAKFAVTRTPANVA